MSKQESLFKNKLVPAKEGSGKLFEKKIIVNDSPVVCFTKNQAADARNKML